MYSAAKAPCRADLGSQTALQAHHITVLLEIYLWCLLYRSIIITVIVVVIISVVVHDALIVQPEHAMSALSRQGQARGTKGH